MSKESIAPKLQEIELVVNKPESDAVIVTVNGWRMRVYKEKDSKANYAKGQTIVVSYIGDIDKPGTIQFNKLNS